MPLTYNEAKIQVVGDAPAPKANTQEHQEILKIMKLSGWSSVGDQILAQRGAPPPPVILKPRTVAEIINPINAPIQSPAKSKPISKHDWLAIKTNRDKFMEIINKK